MDRFGQVCGGCIYEQCGGNGRLWWGFCHTMVFMAGHIIPSLRQCPAGDMLLPLSPYPAATQSICCYHTALYSAVSPYATVTQSIHCCHAVHMLLSSRLYIVLHTGDMLCSMLASCYAHAGSTLCSTLALRYAPRWLYTMLHTMLILSKEGRGLGAQPPAS